MHINMLLFNVEVAWQWNKKYFLNEHVSEGNRGGEKLGEKYENPEKD